MSAPSQFPPFYFLIKDSSLPVQVLVNKSGSTPEILASPPPQPSAGIQVNTQPLVSVFDPKVCSVSSTVTYSFSKYFRRWKRE